MTSRERMQTALRQGTPDGVPTYLCYHELYVQRHSRLEYLWEYRRRLRDHARYPFDPAEDEGIRRGAVERVLDLFTGRVDHCFAFPSVRVLECDVVTPQLLQAAIRYIDTDDVRVIGDGDAVHLEGRAPHGNWAGGAALETRADVDRHFAPDAEPAPTPAVAEPESWPDLRARHGAANAELFRCGSFPTPFCIAIGAFGYQGAMLAMHDRPEVLGYFIERVTGQWLGLIRDAAVEGFWFDEYYTDVISPRHYDEYVWRPNVALAEALQAGGKLSMYYFCGDIMSRLERVLTLEVNAIACEESKKRFRVDIAEVQAVVGSRKALVGNMDGLQLLPRGSPGQIQAEVRRQLAAAAREGGFVMGAGSPIAPDTPLGNMRTFLDTTRELGIYPLSWA